VSTVVVEREVEIVEVVADGPQGPPGAAGADGSAGVGVPAGGSTGQVLTKIDGSDFNTQWSAPSGGASNLDGLSDVAVSAPATGHILRHNGTQFVNALGTAHFAAASHTHSIANVTGLQSALDSKASFVHTHGLDDLEEPPTPFGGELIVWSAVFGEWQYVAGSTLFAALSHTHSIANVTGLQSALDGKAALAHSHAIGDVTGLQTALDARPYVLARPLNVVVANTTSESDLVSVTVPGGALGTTRTLRAVLNCDYLNNSGSDRTFTLRIKLGSTTLYDAITIALPAAATRRAVRAVIEISNIASAAVQAIGGFVIISNTTAPTAGIGQLTTDEIPAQTPIGNASGGAEDTSTNKTFAVTVQHSAADANLAFRLNAAVVEVV